MSDLKTTRSSFKKPVPVNVGTLPSKSGFHIDSRVKELLERDATGKEADEARIQDEITKRLASLSSEAYEAGHQKGYEDGKTKAQIEQETWIAERTHEVGGLVDWLLNLRRELLAKEWDVIFKSLLAITKKLTSEKYEADQELIKGLFLRILDEYGTEEVLKVHAHPMHLESLNSLRSEIKEKFDKIRLFSVIPDQSLTAADLIVETDWQKMDASLNMRVEDLWKQYKQT